jgi:hypothetical protein
MEPKYLLLPPQNQFHPHPPTILRNMYPVSSVHSTHMWCILFILLWPLMALFLLQVYHWQKHNRQEKTEVLGGKPVPLPLYPPQVPQGLTRNWTRASVVGSQGGLGYDINTLMCNMIHFWSWISYKFICFRLWIDICTGYLGRPCTEDSFRQTSFVT